MNVLLVEDDPLIYPSLEHMLAEFGRVSVATTIESALTIIDTTIVEMALIDRCLPDGDGLEVLEYLQTTNPYSKSLLITNLSSLPDRLEGWRKGADDYIAKPFAREELRLRVSRLTILQKESLLHWETFGDIRFNPSTGEAWHQQNMLHFRPKEFQLFLMLWRHKGHILSRDELITSVWGCSVGPTRATLDVYIRRTRIVLKHTKVRIGTSHGIGYFLKSEMSR